MRLNLPKNLFRRQKQPTRGVWERSQERRRLRFPRLRHLFPIHGLGYENTLCYDWRQPGAISLRHFIAGRLSFSAPDYLGEPSPLPSGCFLIGLAFAWGDRGLSIMNPSVRLFFMTGDLGALTTFSTFGLETVNALREGKAPRHRRPIFSANNARRFGRWFSWG